MTHTKGPWIVERSEIHDSEVVYINTDSGTWKQGEVCVLYGDLDTNLANARLIASAPDLLEALERLVLAFDVGDMMHTTLNGRGYAALSESRKAIRNAKS